MLVEDIEFILTSIISNSSHCFRTQLAIHYAMFNARRETVNKASVPMHCSQRTVTDDQSKLSLYGVGYNIFPAEILCNFYE